MTLKDLLPVTRKNLPASSGVARPFAELQSEIDSLFDSFWRGFEPWPFEGRAGTYSPRLDMSETEKDIKVTAELPGMDEKDIDISISGDVLTISGEKRDEKEEKETGFYRMERSYGSFSRSVRMPVEVDIDNVHATFKKGVLNVTVPKAKSALEKKKKVEIKAE